ncbi:carbohydrate ABC transporter permease (plasmid) [Halomicrobium sp. HM KBTZ05]|uniref:ABC transporter permease subunit n=1 Tax=Halomicrobium mukohataei TaxID=57705 RepID=A0A847U6R2_9EURY|nr:sugar ABC transporter permease [Halomicrobium mukohataei]NLV08985.1 ABC transporter permease subunit [Halomicrobium mukohataei]
MSRQLLVPLLDQVRFKREQLKDRLPTLPGTPLLFLSPFFLLFGVFLAIPVFYTFYLSFFTFQGVSTEALFAIDIGAYQIMIPEMANLQYVGLDNYRRLLTDSVFYQSLLNTAIIFVVQVPLMVALALGLALVLNAAYTKYKGIFRSLLLLPVSANTVAYSAVFIVIAAEGGIADIALGAVGISPIDWLSDGFWARNLVAFMSVWRWTGYNMIIILAGLQTISPSLYEAAEIGGATKIQKFRHITLPQLKPIMLFVFVTTTIGVFKKFAEPMIVISSGGPINETRTIVYYIWQVAFQNLELGYGSALTVALVAIIMTLSLIQFKVS